MRLLLSENSAQHCRIQQPATVPLVRALCAYAGGLGEALISCSSNTSAISPDLGYGQQLDSRHQASFAESSWNTITWSLPPGACACAEYSILAAARLVVLNFSLHARESMASRRHSWLSILIPSVLHSAYKLRCGILQHAQSKMVLSGQAHLLQKIDDNSEGKNLHSGLASKTSREDERLGAFIAMNCPNLCHILSACDHSATAILQTLLKFEGQRLPEFKVGSGCRKWLNSLVH